jgi:ABC-type antimicrobial peptide transport system permease subunit
MFAGVSLLLAVVGVYGLFASVVASRTREIGLRVALGASRSGMVWMLIRDALLLGSVGVSAGIAGVFATRRLIQTQLFQMRATDAPTLTLVSGVVVATALLACYVASRRAAFVDPALALRAD